MSVQDIAEVLVAEIAAFKKAAAKLEGINKQTEAVSEEMEAKITRLSNTTLPVDTSEMKTILSDLKKVASSRRYLPQWIVITLVIALFLCFSGWFIAYAQYKEASDTKIQLHYYYNQLQECQGNTTDSGS